MEDMKSLTSRYPGLKNCAEDVDKAADMIIELYKNCGTLYTCGNGGSAADSDHICGELLKGFIKKRPICDCDKEKFVKTYDDGKKFADNLQAGLRAVSLHSQSAFLTAYLNDVDPALVYAQALYSLGKPGDILIAISTSGNSENIVNAAKTAKIMGIKVISLTGEKISKLTPLSDINIRVGECETYRVQELHLPVYHYICAKVEDALFDA